MVAFPPRTPAPEILQNFKGINLRQDGLGLADEECLKSINADMHTQLGVLRLRLGRALLNGANLGNAVRTLDRHGNRRYQVAGTALYRNWSSILTEGSLTSSPSIIVLFQR